MRWVSEGLSSQSSSGRKRSSLGTEAAEPMAWSLRALPHTPGRPRPLTAAVPGAAHLLVFLPWRPPSASLVLGREFSTGLLSLLAVLIGILGRQLLILSPQSASSRCWHAFSTSDRSDNRTPNHGGSEGEGGHPEGPSGTRERQRWPGTW